MENRVLICIHLEKDGLGYLNIWQWKRGRGMLPMMCLTEATWDLKHTNCAGSSWLFNFTDSNKTNKNRLDRGWTWLFVAPRPQERTHLLWRSRGPWWLFNTTGSRGRGWTWPLDPDPASQSFDGWLVRPWHHEMSPSLSYFYLWNGDGQLSDLS